MAIRFFLENYALYFPADVSPSKLALHKRKSDYQTLNTIFFKYYNYYIRIYYVKYLFYTYHKIKQLICKTILGANGYNTIKPAPKMKPKIFILEDDESIRELYPYILGEENYDMKTFATAKDFNDTSFEVPNMYILDVMLPDGNGLDIYSELQKNPITAKIPVLIMSAHEEAIHIKGKYPNVDFLPKPFDIVKLMNTVARKVKKTG